MSAADQPDQSDADGGVWSGVPVNPGLSDLAPALTVAGLAVAVPTVVIGVVLSALLPGYAWWFGAILGLVAAAAAVWWLAERADRLVLDALTSTIPDDRHPIRLTNMVDGLTLAGGVIAPAVVVIDDPARNAMAVRRRNRNHLVLTTGLVDALDVVEMEAAVAELLTRLRNGDAETATVGAAVLGRVLIDGPLGPLTGRIGRRSLDRLLPDDRDLEADRQAVSLTRYPPGLIQALEVLAGHAVAPAGVTAGTAHLWLADPAASGSGSSGADESRAPLSLRIDALAEL